MLIAHLTDLHARPLGMTANRVVETNRSIARAVEAVRCLALQPDCVIVSGDLADNGLPDEYAMLRQLLAPLKMPVYLVPGNHDRRGNFQAAFRDYPGIDPAAGHVQYVIEQYPVRIVALDTVAPGHGYGALAAASLDWLEATLAQAPAKPTVIFMHHPPFLTGVHDMDRIRLIDGAGRFKAIVAGNPQIEHVLCGHHHRAIHVRYAGTICSTAPSLSLQSVLDFAPGADGMIVMEPPMYQLHLFIEGQGLVSHLAYVESFDGPYPYLARPDYPGFTPLHAAQETNAA